MRQYIITPAAGKRLIARAMAQHPAVRAVLKRGTLVIVAGTTNGYVAQEILDGLGQGQSFSRKGFRRGVVLPPGLNGKNVPAPAPADVVLVDGVWQQDKTVFDVADTLRASDVILKGGNAVDILRNQAAVLIGDPQAGTAGAVIRAVYGRRVRLIVPIGLEKRVTDDIYELASEMNSPEGEGPRLLPLPGEAFTELEAISLLTGAAARLVAAGGIYGAEGSVWLAVTGDAEQLNEVSKLIDSVASEPPCQA